MHFKFCSGGCPESKGATWATTPLRQLVFCLLEQRWEKCFFFLLKLLGGKTQQWTFCLSLTLQVFESLCSLNSSLLPCPWTPLCLHSAPLQPLSITCSFISWIPKTSHCPSVARPQLLVASPHPLISLIPSSPSLSLHLSPLPDRHSCLWPSPSHCSTVGS